MTEKLFTSIGTPTSDTDRFRMRGHDVLTEILGEKSFSETFYLLVTGNELPESYSRTFDACMVILMDHGITPTALVARMVHDSLPEDVQLPMMAGAMMVGNKFAGTMAGAGEIFKAGVDAGGDPREYAKSVIARHREQKKFIPGYGHPYYFPTDPRSDRMFQIAYEGGVNGRYIELAKVLAEEIEGSRGRPLTLNVTGALGAVLNEVSFPVEVMRGVAAVSRAAGLIGHIYEEMGNPIAPSVVDFINNIEYRDPD
ncbi:MAG: Citrate synthase 1 [Alphaproteobacteria bacterium MarineAlpha11_Bin1]|nr:MAG: Citrate synthase 1 [Alphaproteobacteria bacterium MarineAlpha11_Bin1]|tara:strand:+ start:848 stop:1612 length:765 start_codon:yes stop_codon:yes gene_type:complete